MTVEVAAGVLLRGGGEAGGCGRPEEYLLARRPEGKVYAGYWEFPGGKLEAGETHEAALVRELREELGIQASRVQPWLCREFVYPHATVRLKFFRVLDWLGEIAPIEHSGFAWCRLGAEPDAMPEVTPEVTPILPANGPILRALALPQICLRVRAADGFDEFGGFGEFGKFRGFDAELAHLEKALISGARLIRIADSAGGGNDDSDKAFQERLSFAKDAARLARSYAALVLVEVNGVSEISDESETLAHAIDADGLHYSPEALSRLKRRPPFKWVGASCRSEEDLERVKRLEWLKPDFAEFGPDSPNPANPEEIDWTRFSEAVYRLPFPVFASGKLHSGMLDCACKHGAHGIVLSDN